MILFSILSKWGKIYEKIRKINGVLALFLGAPFLMANSPEPYPRPEEYKNFNISVVETETKNGELSLYEFTINNTGDSYISTRDGIWFSSDENNTRATQIYKSNSTFFGQEDLVGPHSEYKFYGYYSQGFSFDDKSFSVEAYSSIDTNVVFTGENDISKSFTGSDSNKYCINTTVSNLDEDNGYYVAVTIDYDGVEYTSVCEIYYLNDIRFEAPNTFDESKATVKKLVALSYPKYKGGKAVLKGILTVALVAIIGVVILVALPIILIPIIVAAVKRKKEKTIVSK